MENFDLDINFNGIESDIQYLNADGDGKETPETTESKESKEPKKPKKSELATQIDKYTNLFKGLSGYETPAQRQARLEKEKAEEGKRKTILGMNPFVAIGISLILVVGGTIAVIKLKGK
jgi:hypothetical protein